MVGVRSTHVEMHFLSSLACERLLSTHDEINFVSSQAWEGLPYNMRSDLDVMGLVCSTHVEIHFVSSLACDEIQLILKIYFVSSLSWDVFHQHKLRFNLCLRCYGSGYVNTC